MNIVLVIHRLGGGGAQRYCADLASYWAGRGHQVTVITYDPPTANDFEMHRAVERVDLFEGAPNGVRRDTTMPAYVRRLRRRFRHERPDVVVGLVLGANMLAVMATAGLGIPVIGTELIYFPALHRSAPSRVMQRVLYRRLRYLVVQSDLTRSAAAALVGDDRVVVIPTFVSPSVGHPSDGESAWRLRGPTPDVRIVVAGRLEPPKAREVLLHALARMQTSSTWGLLVLGDGSERRALERLAADLGLSDRVHFAGWVPDPGPTLRDSDIFVLSSRFEGGPLSLLEAMSCGLAVVSTDCPTGPSDYIDPERNGLLVPVDDSDAIASALSRLIDDEPLRKRLGSAAAEVSDSYSIERVVAMWDRLLPQEALQRP